MGIYGPITPGTLMEELAFRGLMDYQRESIHRTNAIMSAVRSEKPEEVKNAHKAYLSSASPHMDKETALRDARTRALLEKETSSGPMMVTPLASPKNMGLLKKKILQKKRNV